MKSPCEGCHDYCDPSNRVCVKLTTYKTTLAARDKWWVEMVEKTFCKALSCIGYPNKCHACSLTSGTCLLLQWQSLKKEAGL